MGRRGLGAARGVPAWMPAAVRPAGAAERVRHVRLRLTYLCPGARTGIEHRGRSPQEAPMILVVFALLLLWGVGMLAAVTLGGLLHLLLVIALVVFVARTLRRRRRAA